ncbi:MAG: hypothetical protein JNJ85_16100, partial [Candidatus Kapabacteria bacterium]|nr:hypothetical protein [Candidatus Kapabacteria bacterium]
MSKRFKYLHISVIIFFTSICSTLSQAPVVWDNLKTDSIMLFGMEGRLNTGDFWGGIGYYSGKAHP